LRDNIDNRHGDENMDPDRPELYTQVESSKERLKGSIFFYLNKQLGNKGSNIKGVVKEIKILDLLYKSLMKRDNVVSIKGLAKLKKFFFVRRTIHDLSNIYDFLEDDESRTIFLYVIAFRILGFQKIKLPLNSNYYWEKREQIDGLASRSDKIKSNFRGMNLQLFELAPLGFSLKLYSTTGGVLTIFALQEYRYLKNNSVIEAQYGDYVIDAGGCWGDSALYFAEKVGDDGRVYSFEFIPSNIDIISKSLALNPKLKERITVVRNPLWCESDLPCGFTDLGPASRINIGDVNNEHGIKTITIDDFVKRNNLPKLDFIKMDIEGAELFALRGAINSIIKYKPKLAISVYHNEWDDLVEIPKFISALNIPYKFYFDHFTIHNEESILFAIPMEH